MAEVEQKQHTFYKFTLLNSFTSNDEAIQHPAAAEAEPGFAEESALTARASVEGQGACPCGEISGG